MQDPIEGTIHRVAREFHLAEASAEATAIDSTRLLLASLEERRARSLSLKTTAAMIRHLSRSQAAAMQAREELLLAHGAAVRVQNDLGETAYGDDGCPPPERFFTSATIVALPTAA